jgi:hypothetical protein
MSARFLPACGRSWPFCRRSRRAGAAADPGHHPEGPVRRRWRTTCPARCPA